MFLDIATIFCKAGDGGDGAVAFHREKYIPSGGPDGGDGGKGGSIYFIADRSLSTLISFRYTQHYRAKDGDRGQGNTMFGKSADDIIIRVPRGTVVKDAETGGIIADIFNYDEKVLVLEGGKGGRGNAKFATAIRRTPNFSEKGEKALERKLVLELKTIADVGLVGFPNVGKSTLLSVISSAKPKIANYPFTTIVPNLGVVSFYDKSYVVADIPGLIEGAAEGLGLGHDFLRHIERVRLIAHIVDISGSEGREPIDDYRKIRKELKKFSPELAALEEIVVANKCDLTYDEEKLKEFKKKVRKPVIVISSATTFGITEFKDKLFKKLETLPEPQKLVFDKFTYEKLDVNAFEIANLNGVYIVKGGLVEDLARKVIFEDYESFRFFQRNLREKGVIDALKKKGCKDGDTVRITDLEFEFVD